jgi:hypothetical protein
MWRRQFHDRGSSVRPRTPALLDGRQSASTTGRAIVYPRSPAGAPALPYIAIRADAERIRALRLQQLGRLPEQRGDLLAVERCLVEAVIGPASGDRAR